MNFVSFRRMTAIIAFVVWIFATPVAHSQQERSILEVTTGDTDVSYADDSDWGWWSPHKYDEWLPGGDTGFDLEGIRITIPSTTYGLILAWETYPTMQAHMSRFDEPTGDTVQYDLFTDIETYDLAFNRPYSIGSGGSISPILGVTYMAIDEDRRSIDSEQASDHARTRLWGVVGGVDGQARLADRLEFAGRLLIRWGSGDRNATNTEDVEGAGLTQVTSSDSTDRIMWDAELGLRFEAHEVFKIEGGYRYRDWTYDNGPASFDGYYLRFIFVL